MPRHWHLRKNKRFPSTHAWEPLYIKVRESFSLYHFITKFVLRFLENRCLKDVYPNANLNEGRRTEHKKTARSRNYLLQFSLAVIPLGFEPKTYCLEGSCSNPTELRNQCEKRVQNYCFLLLSPNYLEETFSLGVHREQELFVVFGSLHARVNLVHGFHRGHVADGLAQNPHAVERGLVLQQIVAASRRSH